MSDDPALDGHLFGPDQPCFGCAPEHPIGFRLRFERIESGVRTRFTPEPRYQGPPGIMHGGLVTTLADEIGAWALIGALGKFGFTASLEAKFRGPMRIGQEVVGEGRIEKEGRRVVDVRVTLTQAEVLAADVSLRFVLLDRQGAERLLGGPLPEAWKRFARS